MGKTLVVFATKHGCTEQCAGKLGAALSGEVVTLNIKDAGKIDLAAYDAVAVGGSIHAGKVQRSVQDFCAKHQESLKGKRLGLFICCMEEGAKADEEFAAAFPKELVEAAAAKGLFGGALDLERMNWLEKALIKKMAKITASVSKINEGSIAAFARALNGPAA
ncbi:MAG TPA: flavodoxin domain-containing protein [Acidobacteriota bacterium]|nr:flavodoxin domain-containing protein [Acidobacteriota bacterium]